MKKITLFLFLVTISVSQINAQSDINFDASETWIGFMNVFELPANGSAFQFASPWGFGDLVASVDTQANTITLKPNRIGDTAPYWQTDGVLQGNKLMEANSFVEKTGLAVSPFTWNGTVSSFTLGTEGVEQDLTQGFTATAFIKVLNPANNFDLVFEARVDLIDGENFQVSYDGSVPDANYLVQYGFTIVGPNVNSRPQFDDDYDALGSIVVSPNASLSTNDLTISEFKVTPNPTNDYWSIKAPQIVESVTVYDILGKAVITQNANLSEVNLDASQLRSGIYLARIVSASGTKTIKLVKN